MTISAAHSLSDLKQAGLLGALSDDLQKVAAQFSVAVTPAMLSVIDKENPYDPIAAQFVPTEQELNVAEFERADPIGDEAHSPSEGLVHRYPDRVLLKLVNICAVYCRFCFRREKVGAHSGILKDDAVDKAIDYIAQHDEIWEVILSGGDPLMLSDRRLELVLTRLRSIPHVKVIRLHTRVPVVDPARITPALVSLFRHEKPTYILIHCNHARELTKAAREACARLVDAGIPLLSQSVLLRGVNDDIESLTNLMRAFVENRIKPHYLHHPDLAKGTSHFRRSIGDGQKLMREMRGRMSGLCQPLYILDIPGGYGKVPIGPVYISRQDAGWTVEDYRGHLHDYGCEEEA